MTFDHDFLPTFNKRIREKVLILEEHFLNAPLNRKIKKIIIDTQSTVIKKKYFKTQIKTSKKYIYFHNSCIKTIEKIHKKINFYFLHQNQGSILR